MSIYLDHNAGSPIRPEAGQAALKMLARSDGNPASVHRAGQRARRALEDARAQVAALVGAEPREIVFTSGGTESNNLAIFGALSLAGIARRSNHFGDRAFVDPGAARRTRAPRLRGGASRAGSDGRICACRGVAEALDDDDRAGHARAWRMPKSVRFRSCGRLRRRPRAPARCFISMRRRRQAESPSMCASSDAI